LIGSSAPSASAVRTTRSPASGAGHEIARAGAATVAAEVRSRGSAASTANSRASATGASVRRGVGVRAG
jgi:hypothetical protein